MVLQSAVKRCNTLQNHFVNATTYPMEIWQAKESVYFLFSSVYPY